MNIVSAIDEGKLAESLVAVTDGILQSVTAQVNAARLDPGGAVDALVSKTQTLTSSVYDAAEKLDAKLRFAREENEQVKKSANAKRTSANAQVVAAAKSTADKASENIGQLDAVDDRVQRVLKMFNLEVACERGS